MKKSKPSAIIILAFFCNSYCNAQSHASADALYDAITGAISGTIQVSGNYNMDELTGNRLLPMIVHSGVDVQGDYDLLSEPNSSFATTSPSGTLIYTTNRGTVSGTDVLSDSYVFVMEPGSAIKNIRIRGGMWSWFDYNLENALTTNKLSGGILIDNIGNNTSYAISNCEIFGFSYAGIFISKKTKAITIEKCYIHNIKGICEPGTGYGIWLQSEGFWDTNNFTDINSVIFGDLKGAIDGTAGPRSWNINDCTFSWFSKVVNKHNGNFKAYHPANSNVLCQGSAGPDCEFFDRPNNFTSISTDVPFRVNDLAGGSIAMTKNISHNGGLGSVPYPYYTESKTDINLPMPANLCTVNNLLASGGILNTIPCCSTGTTNYGWSGIPIGFNFFLNNQPVPITSCNISSNGFVEFNNPAGFGSIFNLIPSAPIPDPNVPNNIIYALWGNFKCDQNTKISYCLDGSGTNHEFIVYWENLEPASYVGVNPDHIFYLKLHETTNEIEIGIFRAEIKPAVIGWEDIFGTTAHIIFNYNNDPDPDKGVYKTHSANPVIYHVLPPHNFNIEISGNSIQMEQGACNSYESVNNMEGYFTLADNYVESCPWQNDANIQYGTLTNWPAHNGVPDNSFSYIEGTAVTNGCPQPPEAALDLKNISGNSLGFTANTNPVNVQYLDNGNSFKLETKPSASGLGSQNLVYIMRPNPVKGDDITNTNWSATLSNINNHFFTDEITTAPSTTPQLTTFSYDAAYPGLYGIDVIAIAADNTSVAPYWNKYHASNLYHIPLIMAPPGMQWKLIFHIKDSYYEKYISPGVFEKFPKTGIIKEVKINGHAVWSEDIADGGDDWERIEIPLTNTLNPQIEPDWFASTGNVLSFSISYSSAGPHDADYVRGVSVWVDDVYINKYGSSDVDNLIKDGDLENEPDLKLAEYTAGPRSWFKINKNDPGYPIVCYYPCSQVNPAPEEYYPDGTPIPQASVCPAKGDEYLASGERKSGRYSIVLNLPDIKGKCDNYAVALFTPTPPPSPGNVPSLPAFFPGVSSVITEFDADKSSCSIYSNPFTATSGNPLPGNYDLNGNITLTGNLTISDCSIDIGRDFSITIPSGSNYILTISNSHLYPCGDRWQGIINNGGTVIIDQNSIIEGATEAINAEAGELHITYSTFNNNVTDVHAHDADFTASEIIGNQFTYNAVAAFDKNMPKVSILIENVSFITIGGGTSVNDKNSFTGKEHGIYTSNSSFTAYNNWFSDIGRDENEEPGVTIRQGAGIFAISDDATIANVEINDGNNLLPNKFSNCVNGIRSFNISNLIITKNNTLPAGGFENCYNGITIYSAPENSNTTVSENDLSGFNYGVYLFDFGQNALFHIDNNWFNCDDTHTPLSFNAATSGYKAINIQNPLTIDVAGTVLGNVISNTLKGIHLRNIANRHPGQLQIGIAGTHGYSNQMHYLNTPAPTGNDHYFGYWFENCDNLEVDNNIALSNSIPLGAGIDKRFRGFSVDNTTNSNFCSNKAEQMGSGVWVYNKCGGTYFKGTNTDGCADNFHLSNATLPTQTDAFVHDFNNVWHNKINWDFNGTLAAVLDWYSNNPPPPANISLSLPALNFYSATGGSLSDCQSPPMPLDEKRKENFGTAVTDTADYGEDFPNENKYLDKEGFYAEARKDPSILVLGLPDDQVFIDAYDSLNQTNVAVIADVKELIDSGETAVASVVNNTITPANNSEINSKSVHELLIAHRTNGILTTVQKQAGHSVSQQTVIEGGMDVYIIRALLNEDVIDDIDASVNARKAHHFNELLNEIPFAGKVFPNPAKDEITYTCNIVKDAKGILRIVDMLGKALVLLPIQNGKAVVNTSQFAPGVYYYSCNYKNVLKQTGRFTIIR